MAQKLPSNLDAERMVLGSIVLDHIRFPEIASIIVPEDFSTEVHRIIFRRMVEMASLREPIDRMTLANELMRYNELETVGGLSYLVTLDDGLPKLPNVASYAKIVREKSSLRKLIFTANKIMNQAMLDQDPANEIVASAIEKLHDIAIDSGLQTSFRTEEVIRDEPGLEALLSPEPGIPTGFAGIDRLIYGLRKGLFYIIAADTTTGKTGIAINIAHNITKAGVPVLYYTMEMGKEEIVQRLLSADAEVSLDKINRRETTKSERDKLRIAADNISLLPLHIEESSSISILDFYRKTDQMIRDHKIALAILDYIQIMDWQSGRNGMPKFNREFEAIAYETRHFKEYARYFQIPILVVSQLSRQRALRSAKDLKPKLRDMSGGSSLEKDADVAMLLYRPELDHPTQPELKGQAEMIIGKNRGGMQGTVPLWFQGEYTRFVDADRS